MSKSIDLWIKSIYTHVYRLLQVFITLYQMEQTSYQERRRGRPDEARQPVFSLKRGNVVPIPSELRNDAEFWQMRRAVKYIRYTNPFLSASAVKKGFFVWKEVQRVD